MFISHVALFLTSSSLMCVMRRHHSCRVPSVNVNFNGRWVSPWPLNFLIRGGVYHPLIRIFGDVVNITAGFLLFCPSCREAKPTNQQ